MDVVKLKGNQLEILGLDKGTVDLLCDVSRIEAGRFKCLSSNASIR